MTTSELESIIFQIHEATFHMDDTLAKSVIDKYIRECPELLEHHEIEWYYKYC